MASNINVSFEKDFSEIAVAEKMVQKGSNYLQPLLIDYKVRILIISRLVIDRIIFSNGLTLNLYAPFSAF